MTALSSDDVVWPLPAPGGLTACVVAADALDAAQVAAMFRLYAAHYADTSADLFRRDLARKTHVLLLTRSDGGLRGFTTIEVYRSSAAGHAVQVIFSGDTIVAPQDWGSQALALEWIRFAGTVARHSASPVYWLLIVKGHRTYRFLPAFARRYLPHHALPEDPAERAMLCALAREKFGDCFDPVAGVVRFPTPRGRLADGLAEVPEQHRRLAAVAHFLRLNPGYRAGDELVCLCRLELENLRPFAARAFAAEPEPAL
jgi:hypothetical protein